MTETSAPGVGAPETTRLFVYIPDLHLLVRLEPPIYDLGDPIPETDYIWFGSEPVAQASTDESVPLRYTFTDHLGTPLLQTDPTAAVVWRAEYEPYGAVFSYRTGDITDPQILRLPGQEETPARGGELSYNIFRWYRAGCGRYTQSDPLYMNSQASLYAYVKGNPLRWRDPLGLDGGGPSWDYEDGPRHPDRPVSCTAADDCPTLKTKTGLISRTIASHKHWDALDAAIGGSGNRHSDEIEDWINAIDNCKQIYERKCRNDYDKCKPCKLVKEAGPVMVAGYIIYKIVEFFVCPPLVP